MLVPTVVVVVVVVVVGVVGVAFVAVGAHFDNDLGDGRCHRVRRGGNGPLVISVIVGTTPIVVVVVVVIVGATDSLGQIVICTTSRIIVSPSRICCGDAIERFDSSAILSFQISGTLLSRSIVIVVAFFLCVILLVPLLLLFFHFLLCFRLRDRRCFSNPPTSSDLRFFIVKRYFSNTTHIVLDLLYVRSHDSIYFAAVVVVVVVVVLSGSSTLSPCRHRGDPLQT